MAKQRGTYIEEYIVADGTKDNLWEGLNTKTDDQRSLLKGQTGDALNWITSQKGDNIQLRRGKAIIGTTRRVGSKVSGLGVSILSNGNQAPIFTSGQKMYYFNGTDTVESTTPNLLGASATGDDVSIFSYENLAGSWLFITSPNSSIFKVPAANPGSATDQNAYGAIPNYRFQFAKADQGVFMGVNRYGKDPSSRDATGFYIGRVDTAGGTSGYPMFMPIPNKPSGIPQVNGLMTSGTYYYVITAVNANGVETLQSSESTGVTIDGSTDKGIVLTWTPIAGAAYYKIYRTMSSGTYGSSSLAGTTQQTATQPNINPLAGTFTDESASTTTGQPPSSTTIITSSAIATGDGSTRSFSGTLTYYYNGKKAPITGFGIQITDGNEIFNDDKNGNLVGSLGGTGTINYATGAYTVMFKTAPVNNAPITYSGYAEDATSGGILDFTINGSDMTGQYAQIFRQDDAGGPAMGVASFQGIQYILHQLRTWNTQISVASNNDRTFTNNPYWSKIGIPYFRAFFETGDGVLYMDVTDAQNPVFSVLEIPPNSTNLTVVPVPLSEDLDLSGYNFSKCVVWRWGQYDFLTVSEYVNGILNTFNSKTFMRDIYSGNWNLLDYTPSCVAEYLGTLIAGDSLSPNVYTLFSGFDDDGSPIINHWNTAYSNIGLQGLKEVGFIHVSGLIQPNQSIQIALSLDFGQYVTYFTIQGNGTYVNRSIQVEIGGETLGSSVIGSGEGGGSVYANPFEIDIPVHTDLFEYISTQLNALNVGFAQIDSLSYKDVRWKQRSILPTQSFNQ